MTPLEASEPTLEPCRWCVEGDTPKFLDRDGTLVSITGNEGVLSHAHEEYWWPCLKFGVEIRSTRVSANGVPTVDAVDRAIVLRELMRISCASSYCVCVPMAVEKIRALAAVSPVAHVEQSDEDPHPGYDCGGTCVIHRFGAALGNIASQRLRSEIEPIDGGISGDFEGAYDTMINVARDALAPASSAAIQNDAATDALDEVLSFPRTADTETFAVARIQLAELKRRAVTLSSLVRKAAEEIQDWNQYGEGYGSYDADVAHIQAIIERCLSEGDALKNKGQ